jgi:acetolactate synthase-1/2/3 large subunit
MTDEKVDTYDLVDKIFNKLTSEDIITPESSGAAGEVTYQAMRIKKGQLVKNAAGLGSMGFGLPYSIGACLATKRRTILINGDGAFQLNIQELETLSRLQLPIKIFILNNGGYGSIENTQDNMFQGFYVGANAKSGFTLPDIGKIATAYGLRVEYIDCVNEVESGIDCTLDGKNPVVCIVKTGKTIISPKVQAIKLPDGNMQSKPLHDMWPYLSKEELESNMFRE